MLRSVELGATSDFVAGVGFDVVAFWFGGGHGCEREAEVGGRKDVSRNSWEGCAHVGFASNSVKSRGNGQDDIRSWLPLL